MRRFNSAATPTPGVVYEITGTGLVPVAPPPPPTAEELERRRLAQTEYEAASIRKRDAFVNFCGRPEKVSLPERMMAVTLSIKYDNSDSMTDYFDRHASLSPDFVVLLVKKQAQTERLARKALDIAFPDGSSLEWEWKTEKYSMGHGNYLESSGFELPPELQNLADHYRAGGVTHAHWEIEFNRHSAEFYPHKNFGRCSRACESADHAERVPISGITFKENAEKHGLELYFPSKPDEATRDELKAAGWHWSRFGGCWYIKDTPERRAWVAQFIERRSAGVPPAPLTPVVLASLPPADMALPAPKPQRPTPQIPPMPGFSPLGLKPAPAPMASGAATAIPSWRQRFYKR